MTWVFVLSGGFLFRDLISKSFSKKKSENTKQPLKEKSSCLMFSLKCSYPSICLQINAHSLLQKISL